ncbi:MAG: type II/IV secretion system protein [Hyphomicrobiales bacterium]|nr:type II/IV secretion system protein [Hyphomicrobiales bacterium]MCC2103096.1 type II/IV secretion system protein [Hyphomicrobiales bacterium]
MAATGERFDHVLTKLGLISESDLFAQLAAHLGNAPVSPEEMPAAPVLPDLIELKFVQRHGALPLACDDRRLLVATSDPLNDEPLKALAYLVERPIEARVITPVEFERAVVALYRRDAQSDFDEAISLRGDGAAEFDLQRLRDLASEAPIIRLVNQIIANAVESGASDIHIEPGPDAVLVRYRIDGALRTAQTIAPNLQAAVVSRIKIMSKRDIAERRLPQDGRIKIAVRGVDIDFRVSTVPTMFGESVVMRILDRRAVELDFVKLGFSSSAIGSLRALMRQPNGIVLVTGPTGSGKTTTLYTALKEINRPEVKIFTVEDPVEYQLAGVNQVQVQPAIGLDFPHVLRAILRQDPDIVMIGEIRDLETAKIAIQASLTGHLVFSTLHTNDAAASIARLLDMGIEDYLLASTIKGVLAQRLVRKLCPHCSSPDPNAGSWANRLAAEHRQGQQNFRSPVGCEACNGVGYKGRTTIAELMIVDHGLQARIHESASDTILEQHARENGMRLLFEDGLAKAWRGETSIDEVLRATRAS